MTGILEKNMKRFNQNIYLFILIFIYINNSPVCLAVIVVVCFFVCNFLLLFLQKGTGTTDNLITPLFIYKTILLVKHILKVSRFLPGMQMVLSAFIMKRKYLTPPTKDKLSDWKHNL